MPVSHRRRIDMNSLTTTIPKTTTFTELILASFPNPPLDMPPSPLEPRCTGSPHPPSIDEDIVVIIIDEDAGTLVWTSRP
jgi:hypothetical protein